MEGNSVREVSPEKEEVKLSQISPERSACKKEAHEAKVCHRESTEQRIATQLKIKKDDLSFSFSLQKVQSALVSGTSDRCSITHHHTSDMARR